MSAFLIEGGAQLRGEILVSGNKNAALPMLAATLLTDQPVTLDRLPAIADAMTMREALVDLGAVLTTHGDNRLTVHAANLSTTTPNPSICQRIRASFVLAGPLLARAGRAELPAPGGDRIGRRPLDAHVSAFQELGAAVEVKPDSYVLSAPRGLIGAEIFLEEMSVLATENVLMAATLAKGTTIIRNAASEPHVQDLARMLTAMGAQIRGVGTNVLRVQGVDKLHGAQVEIGPDYIEVGSFIALAAATGGELLIKRARPEEHHVTANAFGRLGVHWEDRGDDIFVPGNQNLVVQEGLHGAVPRIHDAPWPGFPADLTSIALVLATQASGTVLIHEWMYESRLYWVDRLISMGAKVIVCDPHRAVVIGKAKLYGQVVSSPDIRAGMSLLIAAMIADGRSVIHNAQQIDRGYERIDTRLQALGANIQRVDDGWNAPLELP